MASSSAKPALEDEDSIQYMKKRQDKTLLAKYDIPVSHLDYAYIATCENGREMEKIVVILRSGEEGCYPDLLQKAEDKLRALKPDSKVLRVDTKILTRNSLDTHVQEELLQGIQSWCGDMRNFESELMESGATKRSRCGLPEVRNSASYMTDSGETRRSAATSGTKRIASCDYDAWDKYDPDTELLKMDLEEEKNREKAKRDRANDEKDVDKTLQQITDVEDLSISERQLLADRQRVLGNESHRAGDYKVAIFHYSNSLQLSPTAAAYANRAATNLKLKRFQDASDDCDAALALEHRNVKANLRKGEALQGLGDHVKAMEYYEYVIKIDPNNNTAQKAAYECSNLIKKRPVKTFRMKIDDKEDLKPSPKIVELDEGKENQRNSVGKAVPARSNGRMCLVPIASTSNFCGPSVFEIMVPDDVALTKVDPSLVHTKTRQNVYEPKRNSPRNKSEPTVKVQTENQDKQTKASGKQENSENINKSPVRISEKESRQQEIKEKSETSSAETSAKSNKKQRRSLQEQEVRAQMRADERETRRTRLPEQNFPFSIFYRHDIGAAGDPTIKVASKYNNATSRDSEFWAEKKTLKNNSDSEPSAKRFHRALRIVNDNEVGDDNSSFNGNACVEEENADIGEGTGNVVTPYEFLKLWESIKGDGDYARRARLLRKLDVNSLNTVIGNKLDANMLSAILICLKQYFLSAERATHLVNFLNSLCRLPRFSVIAMFLDATDKNNLDDILKFIQRAGLQLNTNMKIYL